MTEYFDKPGKANTERTLELAIQRARERGLDELVVATNTGDTAGKLLELAEGMKVVAIALHSGFDEPFEMELTPERKEELADRGVTWVTGPHALSGVERAISTKFGGLSPAEVAAHTLRILGQGTKVCVECVVMAADAGALSGRDLVAVGGTSQGADTACVIKPAHSKTFFDMRIREIVCKPRNF